LGCNWLSFVADAPEQGELPVIQFGVCHVRTLADSVGDGNPTMCLILRWPEYSGTGRTFDAAGAYDQVVTHK
jgi:hypothetical protein